MQNRFGPLLGGPETIFRLWAPGAEEVQLLVEGRPPVPMTRRDDGFHAVALPGCGPGTPYRFRIGDLDVPDPAARRQAGDVEGWSLVCAPLPPGRAEPRRPWHETVCCEVHVGTASPEGTFAGLMQRLEHFRDAGYTALELMPVAEFAGARNWGYDGTLLFAPESSYGPPEALRALVDRAHELGLAVLLDVVYNHFGDIGNFLAHYAPGWFDDEVDTPWGAAIDFRNPTVRAFYYENARMWLSDYDFDGLRFDAVHEIKTAGRDRFLGELAAACRAVKPGAALVIENADKVTSLIARDAEGRPPAYTAQWNDGLRHALHFLVTGERKRGYGDPARDAVADLGRALAHGFVNDGKGGPGGDGGTTGGAGSSLPPAAFVSFIQNHDQIGNRADAARLPQRAGAEELDFLYFVLFLCPQPPLFFAGDEAHLRTGFPYFVDIPADRAAQRQRQRLEQMRGTFEEEVPPEGLPDPNDPATFAAARIDWAAFDAPDGRAALARFRQLAAWRRDMVWPLAATAYRSSVCARQDNGLIVTWAYAAGYLSLALNPTDRPLDLACVLTGMPVATGQWCQHDQVLRLGAWSALAWRGESDRE